MYSVFQVIVKYCRQHETLDVNSIPVISQACCATFLSTTIDVINEFKAVLKLAEQTRCDQAMAHLFSAQTSLAKHTEFDFDVEFRQELLVTLQKFDDIFNSAHTEMIAYHIFERLVPHPANKIAAEARSTILEELLANDAVHNSNHLATSVASNPILEFAKKNRAFLSAIFSQNADKWWGNAPKFLQQNFKACSDELQTYIAQIDNHRHLKRRAAIIMPSELIYDSTAKAKSTDKFDHETSCPGMASCGMLSSLIDGLVGLDENMQYKKIIVSRWFELNSLEDEKTISAQLLATNLPDDVKKSLVFNIPYDANGNRDRSSGCAYGQGRFELRNDYVIKQWLDCTAVNDTTLNAVVTMLTQELKLGWSLRTIEMGSHVACDRDEQNILRLLFFRFPRLEEIFTTHLTHLLEAAKDWQTFHIPTSPRRVPLSPITTPPPSSPQLLNRTSPLHPRKSVKRAFEEDDDNANESASSNQNKHANRST